MNDAAKKVILIGGSSYSGSTMLDMMMANSPDGFSVGEVHALFHPYRPHHFTPTCGCGDKNCNLWGKIKKAREANLYKTIFTLLPSVTFIVDSSKSPWWIKNQTARLKHHGVEVHNLLIYKDPAAFAHSMIKRKRQHWRNAWKNYHRLYLSLIPHYTPIAYSKLSQQPAIELKRLCKICGIDFHKRMENFWEKDHHTLFGNNSAKIHTYKGKENAFQQCKKELEKQGCEVQQHKSVYYDNSFLEALPSAIKREIEVDDQLPMIIEAINEQQNVKNLSNIHYSSIKVFQQYAKKEIKRLVGLSIGRYWRIY